ncbi:MAG: alpha-xylosidase [Dictyoglomaceae bacterium]
MSTKLKRLIEYKIEDGKFLGILELEDQKFLEARITLYEKDIWRLEIYSDKPKDLDINLAPIKIRIEKDNEFLILPGTNTELIILSEPFFFGFKRNNKIILSLDNHRNVGLLYLTPPLAKMDCGFCGTFSLNAEERIFGLGEFFTSCEKHSQSLEVWVNDAYGTFTQRAYKPLPFLWSTRGWGIFFNTNYKTRHYIAHPDKNIVGYYWEDLSPHLDLFIFFGEEPKELIQKYHLITGKPEIPPFWSFGLWISRCYYWDEKEVLKVAKTLREKNIPCDVINLDGRAWLRHGYQTDFQWDLERFPNPQRLIHELKNLGFKICLWENPYISERSPLFKEAEENNFFLKDLKGNTRKIKWVPEEFQGLHNPPEAGIVDLTNPKAREWYKDLHRPLLRMGIDTFKTDFGEEIPEDVIAYNGMRGEELHNYYPFLYNQTVYEVVKEEKGEGLVWGRSGYIGSHKIPVQWAGDTETSYEGMFTSLRGGLSYMLSGGNILWAHDLGGFYGAKPDSKLYIRWAEFALLNPLTRAHGTTPREPWEFGIEAERIFKKFVYLRYSLLPYIYSNAILGKHSSSPIMRPLILEFPQDYLSSFIEDEYLLGKNILVAPIFTEENERNIYIPPGIWYDFWEKRPFEGSKAYNLVALLNRIPIFVKEGSIISRFLKIGKNTEELKDLIIEIWFPKKKQEEIFYFVHGSLTVSYSYEDYLEINLENNTDFPNIYLHILGLKSIKSIEPSTKFKLTPYGTLLKLGEESKFLIEG